MGTQVGVNAGSVKNTTILKIYVSVKNITQVTDRLLTIKNVNVNMIDYDDRLNKKETQCHTNPTC